MLKGRKVPCSLCAGIPSNGIHFTKPDQQDKEQSKRDYNFAVKRQGLCVYYSFAVKGQGLCVYTLYRDKLLSTESERPLILP